MSEPETLRQDSLYVQSEEGRSAFTLLFFFPSSTVLFITHGAFLKYEKLIKG